MKDETQTSYHRFLIRHRIYCERCEELNKATKVRNYNGKDYVLCQKHATRLDAVRVSEREERRTHKAI